MSHVKNKVEWCLKKSERELKESGKHRGLVRIKPDLQKAKDYINKSEHYLKATEYLKNGNFSDISASTVFYSMYHCLLAIAAKQGYESGNQVCTFALIYSLIQEGKMDFKEAMLDRITSLNVKETDKKTTTEIREQYQYGTELTIKDDIYKELIELAKEVISITKVIIEE